MGVHIYVGESTESFIVHEYLGTVDKFYSWRNKLANSINFNLNEINNISFNNGHPENLEPYYLLYKTQSSSTCYTTRVPRLLNDARKAKNYNVDYDDESEKIIDLCHESLESGYPIIFLINGD